MVVLQEETIVKYDFSPSLQKVFHDVFSPESGEKDQHIAHFSVQDQGVLDPPIFDKYSDGEEKIPFVALRSNQPVYDSYELDCAEEQYCEEISHPEST